MKRKLSDLKPNECIVVKSKKQLNKLLILAVSQHVELTTNSFDKPKWVCLSNGGSRQSHTYKFTVEYPASDFLPSKKSKLKQRVEKLEVAVDKLRNGVWEIELPAKPSKYISELSVQAEHVQSSKDGWHKYNGALVFIVDGVIKYGFDHEGIWKHVEGVTCGDEQPATESEVSEALIAEAKRRNIHLLNPNYNAINNSLYSGVGFEKVFENGIWKDQPLTELPEKEIDWSVPGQFVVNSKGTVVMTTGKKGTLDINTFNGVVVSSCKREYKLGKYSNAWSIYSWSKYTGEPIILK